MTPEQSHGEQPPKNLDGIIKRLKKFEQQPQNILIGWYKNIFIFEFQRELELNKEALDKFSRKELHEDERTLLEQRNEKIKQA